MKYKILILLSLFIFIPVLNAETYYDWELLEVEELPEATLETINKVYQVNDKYYISSVVPDTGYTPLPLNENLKGKTIYINLPDNFSSIIFSNYVSGSLNYTFALLQTSGRIYLEGSNGMYSVYFPSLIYRKFGGNLLTNLKSIDIIDDLIITQWVTDKIDMSIYFSLTPSETLYNWEEVPKESVIWYKVPEEDFYLFYTFEDISNFNILSNYDLSSFNDFQKIIIVLGFNIFFLGLIGFIVYVFIKLVNKGITMLFR